jgi:DNA repair exonuclease SbcCD ATPase subunit
VITLRSHLDYYYDQLVSGGYLLLNGASDLVDDVMQHMSKSHLKAGKSARSFKPAGNGQQYAWYIHVQCKDGTRPSLDMIKAFMFQYSSTNTYGEDYRQKLHEAETAKQQLETQIAELSKNTINQKELEKLQEEIEQWRNDADTFRQLAEQIEEDANKARKQVQEENDQLLAGSSDENKQLSNDNAILRERCKELAAENATLSNRLDVYESTGSNPTSSRYDDLQAVVSALLPQVEFCGHSWDVLFQEIADYPSVFRSLHQIVHKLEQGKPVQSTSGWYEMNFSTGKANDGRLYFTHEIGAKRKTLISRKRQQDQDIDYIKTLR